MTIPPKKGNLAKGDSMIKKILVPTDGSGHAEKAVNYASDLALKYDAGLYLMHAVQESKIPDGFEEFLKAEYNNAGFTFLEK